MSASTPPVPGHEQRIPVEIEAENFTVIREGQNPVADIVFLHGLQGHPRDTWTFGKTRNGKERGKLARLLHPRPKIEEPSGPTSCFWPEDLLADDFKNVRILTYGYDSHVSHFFEGSASQATVVGLGRSFLNDLEATRRDEPYRPIIFIVHSLGGVVLKEALRRSWRADAYEADLKAVYTSTKAIIFMGTPHRGSDYAPWGIIARNVAVAAGFDANDRLLEDLRADSTMLDLLRDEFGKMLKEEQFRVYTFMEGKGLKGVQGLTGKVVGDESSALNDGRERRDIINANHMGMCRFSGPKDSGYRKVKNAVAQNLSSFQTIPGQTPAYTNLFSKEADDALSALDVGETRNRFENVENAYEETFEWIFKRSELQLQNWLQNGSGLYWIQGKPASGKSTLMKMIYKDPRTQAWLNHGNGEKAQAAFFFHDRGSEKQKSLEGLLQAILYQIFCAIPTLLPCWLSHYLKWKASPNVTVLNKTFVAIQNQTLQKVNICLFLDALDEYSGNHQEMTTFLKNIVQPSASSQTRLKVIFSSRPLQVFLDEFDKIRVPRQFRLQDYTYNDIDIVINTKMESNVRMLRYMNSPDATICQLTKNFALEIASRAEGVFLWVKLVLDSLLEEFSAGDSLSEVQESPLHQLYDNLLLLPRDLEAFYEQILSRVPLRYREEMHIMFEVVRCARSPLSARVFVEVCKIATIADLRHNFSQQPQRDDIERLIRSRSGGLIELVSIKRAPIRDNSSVWHDFIPFRVQFIHQTVRSWIQTSAERIQLVKAEHGEDTGHVYIMKYVLARAIEDFECSAVSLDSRVPLKSRTDITSNHFLFFNYDSGFRNCCSDLMYHAFNAEISTGRSQSAYLNQVTDLTIMWIFNSSTWKNEKEYPFIESMLSFAVVSGLQFFLREQLLVSNVNRPLKISLLHLSVLPTTELGLLQTQRPIIVDMLLDAQANPKSLWNGMTPFQNFCTNPPSVVKDKILSCFLEHGEDPEEIISYTEKFDPVLHTCRPLHCVVSRAEERGVEVLLNYGADVNLLDSQQCTPLDRIYRHLGNQIAEFLTGYSKVPNKTRSLPQKLRIIQLLLDKGGKGGLNPNFSEPDYTYYLDHPDHHDDGDAPITKDMVEALNKLGLPADQRLINLPRMQPSLSTRMFRALDGFRSSMTSMLL